MAELQKGLFLLAILGFLGMGLSRLALLELTHECVCEALRDFLISLALTALGLIKRDRDKID